MAANFSITDNGFKITCWKYFYTIELPNGDIISTDSFTILSRLLATMLLTNIKRVYEAGKQAQNEIIKQTLGIK